MKRPSDILMSPVINRDVLVLKSNAYHWEAINRRIAKGYRSKMLIRDCSLTRVEGMFFRACIGEYDFREPRYLRYVIVRMLVARATTGSA